MNQDLSRYDSWHGRGMIQLRNGQGIIEDKLKIDQRNLEKKYKTQNLLSIFMFKCVNIYNHVHASIRSFLPYSQSIILLVDLINSLSANIENWQFKSCSNNYRCINIGQNMQQITLYRAWA